MSDNKRQEHIVTVRGLQTGRIGESHIEKSSVDGNPNGRDGAPIRLRRFVAEVFIRQLSGGVEVYPFDIDKCVVFLYEAFLESHAE